MSELLIHFDTANFTKDQYTPKVLEQTDDFSLTFTGVFLGSACTYPDPKHPDYSGDNGRSKSIELYMTNKDQYVVHYIQRTQWQGEKDKYTVLVYENLEALVNEWREDPLARDAFDDAGIKVLLQL